MHPPTGGTYAGFRTQASPFLAQIGSLCTLAFADVCAVYRHEDGTQPYFFTARTPRRMEALAEAPFDEQYVERAKVYGLSEVAVEPLVLHGQTIGLLVLLFAPENPRTDADVVTLFASLIAIAIDHEDQQRQQHRVSNRLQQALLPARLAHVDGIAFDTAYRPAGPNGTIGGDWYDVFELVDGSIGISVGDVAGHGLEAAVTMSEIRRAIRTAMGEGDAPLPCLRRIDAMMSAQGVGMASAIVGRYDPVGATLRYSCAGHPAPVLASTSGRALMLPGGGLLLGLGMSAPSDEWTVTLTPGSTCFFYTDGLLEYDRDIVEGERALVRAIESLAGDGTLSAQALQERIFGNAPNHDDVATLALCPRGNAEHTAMTLVYSTVPLSAALCREALRHFIGTAGFIGDAAFDVLTAVGEAVANAIEHGTVTTHSTFRVESYLDANFLRVEIHSRGHWRAFTYHEERGRGLPIMRALTRDVNIATDSSRTTITLTFERA